MFSNIFLCSLHGSVVLVPLPSFSSNILQFLVGSFLYNIKQKLLNLIEENLSENETKKREWKRTSYNFYLIKYLESPELAAGVVRLRTFGDESVRCRSLSPNFHSIVFHLLYNFHEKKLPSFKKETKTRRENFTVSTLQVPWYFASANSRAKNW